MLCRHSEFHAFAIFRQLTDWVLLFIILHWLRHYYLSWCLVIIYYIIYIYYNILYYIIYIVIIYLYYIYIYIYIVYLTT